MYSLLKQNKKSWNAKRRRQRERWKSNVVSAAHSFCTFLCRCFVWLQRKTSRNFQVEHFMDKKSYVFLFTFFLLPLIFILVVAGISHFLTAVTKLSCRSSDSVSFVFFSRSSSLSLFFSWSFAGLSPTVSFSLSFSFSIIQICWHDE